MANAIVTKLSNNPNGIPSEIKGKLIYGPILEHSLLVDQPNGRMFNTSIIKYIHRYENEYILGTRNSVYKLVIVEDNV